MALESIASDTADLRQIIQNAITRELQLRGLANTPARADVRLVAPLRALLADDLSLSRSWGELDNRLRAKGYVLRDAGGGLVLHALATNTRQCCAAELGHSHSALSRRFNAPFPDARPSYLHEGPQAEFSKAPPKSQ